MKLNREQVEKALDWLDSLVGNSNDSEMAMRTYQLLGILYDTCEGLTEKNAIQTITAIELDKQVQRLTEENEKIGIENFDLICELSRIKSDTVRKMQERLMAETLTIQDHTGKLGSVILVSTIEQIAKEILEGE